MEFVAPFMVISGSMPSPTSCRYMVGKNPFTALSFMAIAMWILMKLAEKIGRTVQVSDSDFVLVRGGCSM